MRDSSLTSSDVLFPDESAARREHGYVCPAESEFPKPGQTVFVRSSFPFSDASGGITAKGDGEEMAATASLSYRTSVAEVVSSEPSWQTCSVIVRYRDGTTDTVSAAKPPLLLLQQRTTAADF